MKNKENLKVINRDMMKFLALFIMFTGHLFAWLALMKNPDIDTPYSVMPFWQQILSHMSLFCPPVMFFFIADGYKYTRDRKKYALRLLIFACVTQPFDWLIFVPVYGWWTSNVIFTLFLGLTAIIAWESKYKLWQRIGLIILIIAVNLLIFSDWIIFGIFFILFLHIYRENPKKRFIAFTSIAIIWKLIAVIPLLISGEQALTKILIDNLLDFIPVMLAYLCMTVFYNGKKGKYPTFGKWFFYIFYPLHYLIIYAVFKIM